MKILVVSSSVWPVPLKSYGGLEQIAYLCAKELSSLGHQVTLQAPVGSVMPDRVEHLPVGVGEPEIDIYNRLSRDWQEFGRDGVVISHDWSKFQYLTKARQSGRFGLIGVCHAPIEGMFQKPPPVDKPCLVGISHDHSRKIRRHLSLNAKTVHNGIDLDFYKQNRPERSSRFAFVNRISILKGPDIAVRIARQGGVELDIAGDTLFTREPDYGLAVKSQCDGDKIRWLGPVSREETVSIYSRSKALLNTLNYKIWQEPFGLVPVEAQACGCPVLTVRSGAMSEIVLDGVTGFVCDTYDELADLIRYDAVSDIKTSDCRAWVESRFSAMAMGKAYEKLCEDVMEDREW